MRVIPVASENISLAVDALAKAGRHFTFLPFLGQTHQMASAESQEAVWAQAAETLRKGLATAR